MAGRLGRLWDAKVLPVAVEHFCAQGPIERQREKVIPRAEGRVLEVGVGSGLNLAHYDPSRVDEVIGIDPSLELMRKARRRAARVSVFVSLESGRVEAIPHDDGAFDAVVMTYSLCSVSDPRRALAEIRRVLRPGGKLILSEHGRAPDALPRLLQRRLTPAWSRLGGGCHLDRPIRELLAGAGFDVAPLQEMYLPGPRWLNYHYFGVLEEA